MALNDYKRSVAALTRILAGENSYYKDRLADPEFVYMVRQALQNDLNAIRRAGEESADACCV